MRQQQVGTAVFAVGVAIMIVVVMTGRSIQPTIETIGILDYVAQGPRSALSALFFAFGFPLGLGVAITGAGIYGGAPRGRVALFATATVVGVAIALIMPKLAGKQPSPAYFGLGGISIMLLFAAAAWYWGRYRAGLAAARRTSADLQALGYLCFALAAWNLCGAAGMPGFMVYPDKMQQFGIHFFVIVQLKSIMAFFVLGWLFTAVAFYRAGRVPAPQG